MAEKMSKVKVGIAQMSCVADKAANIERYTEKVRQLAADGAQIICLQELFASLYFCDEERYLQTIQHDVEVVIVVPVRGSRSGWLLKGL